MNPIPTVSQVDIPRFMGDWYVIANIPTFMEKGAHNAIESYKLDEDGTIATTFTFNQGAYDGPVKIIRPRGFIKDHATRAIWGMQFIWPFKAEYRIIYLDPEYTVTVIGRTKRDYVWIMARSAAMDEAQYRFLLGFLERQGYDAGKVQRVPHRN